MREKIARNLKIPNIPYEHSYRRELAALERQFCTRMCIHYTHTYLDVHCSGYAGGVCTTGGKQIKKCAKNRYVSVYICAGELIHTYVE